MNRLTSTVNDPLNTLTDYWLDKKPLTEPLGYDDEDGNPCFTYDGFDEFLAVERRVLSFITEKDTIEVISVVRNYLNNLAPNESFPFIFKFFRFIAEHRLILEAELSGVETYTTYTYRCPSQALFNLRILETIINGYCGSYLVKDLFQNNSIHERSTQSRFVKKLEIKDFLMLMKVPLMTQYMILKKGAQEQFIINAGKAFELEISPDYASNIHSAIENGSFHDMIKDLQKLINEYQLAFNKIQSEKTFKKDF